LTELAEFFSFLMLFVSFSKFVVAVLLNKHLKTEKHKKFEQILIKADSAHAPKNFWEILK